MSGSVNRTLGCWRLSSRQDLRHRFDIQHRSFPRTCEEASARSPLRGGEGQRCGGCRAQVGFGRRHGGDTVRQAKVRLLVLRQEVKCVLESPPATPPSHAVVGTFAGTGARASTGARGIAFRVCRSRSERTRGWTLEEVLRRTYSTSRISLSRTEAVVGILHQRWKHQANPAIQAE